MAVSVKEKLDVRWRLRACKRCRGDMYNKGDSGWKCLQCSGEYQEGFKSIEYKTGRKDKWE